MIFRLLVILFISWLPASFAADSSTGSFSGSLTPTTSSNQPFLLDTGYANVGSPASTWPADGSVPPAGSVYNTGYVQAASTGTPYAMRLTIVTNPHKCPTNFKPVVTVTPFKSLGLGNETMRACADSITDYGQRHYWFGVWVNSVVNSSGAYIPGTAFYWSVYCYPASTYTSTTNQTTINAIGSNACGPAMTTYAPTILLYDTGLVDWIPGSIGSVATRTTTTRRVCPQNYTPYVSISSLATKSGGYNHLSTGGGTCVKSVVANGSTNYTVTFLVSHRYTLQNVSSFYAGSGSEVYTLRKYGDHTVSLCPWGKKADGTCNLYPLVTNVDMSALGDTNDPGFFKWELYCYPPDIAFPPPSYATTCAEGSNPF